MAESTSSWTIPESTESSQLTEPCVARGLPVVPIVQTDEGTEEPFPANIKEDELRIKQESTVMVGEPHIKQEAKENPVAEESPESTTIHDLHDTESQKGEQSDSVTDTAALILPDGLCIIEYSCDKTGQVKKGVWSTTHVSVGTLWGPCTENPVVSHSCIKWQKDPEWMSYVRRAFRREPSNTEAVRIEGQLYYRTDEDLSTPREIVLSRAEVKDLHGSAYSGRLRHTVSQKRDVLYEYSDGENDSDPENEDSDSDPDRPYHVDEDRCTANEKSYPMNSETNTADDDAYQEDEVEMEEADKMDELDDGDDGDEYSPSGVKHKRGEKPFLCPESDCGKRFAREFHLEKHKLTHQAGKPHKCPHCELAFMRRGSLTSHMKVHTGDAPHKCPTCDMGFTRFTSLQSHIREHTGEMRHHCPLCGKGFHQPSSLQAHINIHTGAKPHACPICGKRYASSSAMQVHKQSHTAEKRYKCTQCGRGYLKPEDLARHLETHLREKAFVCRECGKGFDHAGPLQLHMYTHTGEKPLSCTHCGKGFIQLINLQRHVATHSKKKAFKCNDCGAGFNRADNLKKHVQIHYGKSSQAIQ